MYRQWLLITVSQAKQITFYNWFFWDLEKSDSHTLSPKLSPPSLATGANTRPPTWTFARRLASSTHYSTACTRLRLSISTSCSSLPSFVLTCKRQSYPIEKTNRASSTQLLNCAHTIPNWPFCERTLWAEMVYLIALLDARALCVQSEVTEWQWAHRS